MKWSIYDYDGISYVMIWEVVQYDIPDLLPKLDPMLDELDS